MFSGEFAPALYSGPQVTVISSNITSSTFFTTLLLSNASGYVDITSTSASLIWALGSQPPSNPSDPTSSIQQHQDQGNFNVNMKAAQYVPSTTSTSNGTDSSSSNSTTGSTEGTGTTSSSVPYISPIGGTEEGDTGSIGLSSRDKVRASVSLY